MIKFTGKLLIVDDDVKNREPICQSLSKRGFNVFEAGGGNEALNMVKTTLVDLALIRADMRDVTGMDVLKELRNTFNSLQLPVIMVTEETNDSVIAALIEAGANDYVTMPIDIPIVIASIQTQLERKRTEETLRKSEELYTLAMGAANDGLRQESVPLIPIPPLEK